MLNRREFLNIAGKIALAYPLLGVFSCNSGGGGGAPPTGGYSGTDDQLMNEIERAAFQFFWNEANPNNGLIKDRALANGGDTSTLASIASVGFGLTALCIADQRGYASTSDLKARAQTTLSFFRDSASQVHGFFYHYLDMNTGERAVRSEVSPIDTSILLCGILTAGQHFQDAQIASAATAIYQRVDWPWMLNGGDTFALAWTPENGFASGRWDTYNELMMLYLLAIGSPTSPIPASSWDAWDRPTVQFQNISYISGASPLFIHQFSHAWFDFRGKQDNYTNYFDNSVKATRAHKNFCISLNGQFPDYTNNLWGITASDSAKGYVAWGGPPADGPIDGTIVPAAAAGSLPFLPADTIAVLRNIRGAYPATWRRYGFVDAFNPLTSWQDQFVIGIDLGISMLMAENQRTGSVWNMFMANPEARNAMSAVGFH